MGLRDDSLGKTPIPEFGIQNPCKIDGDMFVSAILALGAEVEKFLRITGQSSPIS